MFKSIIKLLRNLIIGAVWTYLFALFSRWLLIYIWHFDILYKKQWIVVKGFWNNNGVIAGSSDYMLLLTMLILLIVWVIGWKKLCKVNYVKLALKPINYIADYGISKYEAEDKHVTIKNLKVGEKITVEDVIQARIKEENSHQDKEADSLRKSISEKITNYREH